MTFFHIIGIYFLIPCSIIYLLALTYKYIYISHGLTLYCMANGCNIKTYVVFAATLCLDVYIHIYSTITAEPGNTNLYLI
jgi:hypothetical protein